jgi:FkbM family methyltransferase
VKRHIYFDVGCHKFSEGCCQFINGNNFEAYLFEPIPNLYEDIKKVVKGHPYIHPIEKAVSLCDGSAKFNVANFQSCSSLLDFTDEVNETWVRDGHPIKNFEMVETIDVQTIRLDSFMEQNFISHIDYLHIDAQGLDLDVVKSLGKRLRDVYAIQIEICVQPEMLYKRQFTPEEAYSFFDHNNFSFYFKNKQSLDREENVIFVNNDWLNPIPLQPFIKRL